MAQRDDATAGAETERETREVKVDDPSLSASTNARLTERLQEVIGAETVEVPRDRPHPSLGEGGDDAPSSDLATSNSLMVVIGACAALAVAGIVVTATTGSWWFAGLTIVFAIVALSLVATTVIRMTSITERPGPVLDADMQAEGISHPDERFTEIVDEFRKADSDSGEHRQTTVEDDHASAGAEQRNAVTPTGGQSRAVGPQ